MHNEIGRVNEAYQTISLHLREDANSARVLVKAMDGSEIEIGSFFGENERQRIEPVVRRRVDEV